jgi:hypothetical protein
MIGGAEVKGGARTNPRSAADPRARQPGRRHLSPVPVLIFLSGRTTAGPLPTQPARMTAS